MSRSTFASLVRRREHAGGSSDVRGALVDRGADPWIASLGVSPSREIRSRHRNAVLCMDIDPVEGRYLLSGSLDPTVAIYDLQAASPPPQRPRAAAAPLPVHAPIVRIGRSHQHAHRFGVTACEWYPVDSGVFCTASFDGTVRVWDANAESVACAFQLDDRVECAAISPPTAPQCLVAAGAGTTARLCDPVSGALTHTFVGHAGRVLCVRWLPASGFVVATGSSDGQVRLWDIRRAGTLAMLDLYRTAAESGAGVVGAGDRGGGAAEHVEVPSWSTSRRRALVRAHDGAVTAIATMPDGRSLLTAGTDSEVRLWDPGDGARVWRNRLISFPSAFNRASRQRQVAIGCRHLFFPSGSAVQVYALDTGRPKTTLRGQMDTINTCCWVPEHGALASGGADGTILLWEPTKTADEKVFEESAQHDGSDWSDSD
ncbi:unnamed protein product [Pedinophyceae sp. YPF-701]|nr:unnamed protein product [Pedinophyceae sp. YPF-701]